MYSIVLMAALTAAPDTAGFGYGCTGGCGGCTGAVVVSVGCTGCTGTTSCFGSCCGGCYGSSCCGGRGSIFPLFPGLRSRLAGIFGGGCCGGCYGSSCHSSSCYSSCHGSSYYYGGCHSSCHGSGCYSSSCFGSCHGVVTPIVPATACYGCSGYSPTPFGYGSCFGSGAVYYGADFHQGVVAPPVIGSGIVDGLGSAVPSVPTLTIDRSAEFRAAQAKSAAAPARLTVELPASAKLYVDGNLVKGDSTNRNFHTPDLPAGKTFYYDLKAEVLVDGKTVTEEKRVLVLAGDVKAESFEKLIAAVKKDGDKTAVASK